MLKKAARGWICCILILCLIFSSAPAVYAADTKLWDAWSEYAESEVRAATLAEVYYAFGWPVEYLWNDGGKSSAHVGDLLYALSRIWGVLDTDDGYLYPAGDSVWMSAEEWAELSADLSRDIPLGIVTEVKQRTESCMSAAADAFEIKSSEKYIKALDIFCPEFHDLAAGYSAAVEYWLRAAGVIRSDCPSTVGIVLHEVSHESSARSAGSFSGRQVSGNMWMVNWTKSIHKICPYDPLRGENVEIEMKSVPRTLSLVRENTVPEDVRQTQSYKNYFSGRMMANTFGVYGMLEEFAAETVELRYLVMSHLALDWETRFSDYDLFSIYFWDGAIGCYLRALRNVRPNLYRELMEDETFTGVLNDIYEYIDMQVSFMRIIREPEAEADGDFSATRTWSETQGARLLLAEYAAV